jgi:hypothetical protein
MSYLEEYGAAEAKRERREKRIKRGILILLAALVVAGALYYSFKNYRQEERVKQFLAALERGDYPTAYSFWGCRVEAPCPNYDYKSFLEDWGPSSSIGKLQSYKLDTSHERGSGVVIGVHLNGRREVKLWVEKSNGVLGFAPPL